jgi:hypothetical protein
MTIRRPQAASQDSRGLRAEVERLLVSSSTLIRVGGLAAMVGAVAYATLNLAFWFLEPPFSRIIQHLDRDRSIQTLDNIFFVLLVLGALAAIVSLYILHKELYGMTGTLVSLVAFVGLVLFLISGLGDVLRLYWYFASPLLNIMLVALGGMGLGVVTIAARVLPWWCGVALIFGSPGFAFAALYGELWGVLVGVAWAVVGYAIFRAAGRQPEQPSRVR